MSQICLAQFTVSRSRAHYASVTRYNGESSLPRGWWDAMGPAPAAHRAGYGGICTEIHGTDGQQFRPLLQPGQPLWLFTPGQNISEQASAAKNFK